MNSGQITSVIKLGLKEKNCGFVKLLFVVNSVALAFFAQ